MKVWNGVSYCMKGATVMPLCSTTMMVAWKFWI